MEKFWIRGVFEIENIQRKERLRPGKGTSKTKGKMLNPREGEESIGRGGEGRRELNVWVQRGGG